MSLDEESSQPSKTGKGSDALCIMKRGEASSSFPELLQIQRDASPIVRAASSLTAGTIAFGHPVALRRRNHACQVARL